MPCRSVSTSVAEEVVFEPEGRRNRSEVASLLREATDELEGDGELTLTAEDHSLTPVVPSEFD